MERCSVHEWRTPATGDAALVCDLCESRLDLVRDIAPQLRTDILRDYRRRCGPLVGRHFEEALEAAVSEARRRAGDSPPPPPPPPSPGERGA